MDDVFYRLSSSFQHNRKVLRRKMWKLIVSDIDGTLVGDGQGEGALNPSYYEEIRRLTKRGIRFMACSGRQRLSIERLFRPVADQIFYACDGGSMVFDERQLLFAQTLQRDIAARLIADAEKIVIPNVLSSIFASAGAAAGVAAGAVTGTTAGAVSSSAGTASAVSVASSAGMTAAKKASKLG